MNSCLDLYPEYIRDIIEIKELCLAQDKEMNLFRGRMNLMLGEMTLVRTLLSSLKHWNRIFGTNEYTDSEKIILQLAKNNMVTEDEIKKCVEKKCDGAQWSAEYDADAMTLIVKAKISAVRLESLYKYLREVVPCNILIKTEMITDN